MTQRKTFMFWSQIKVCFTILFNYFNNDQKVEDMFIILKTLQKISLFVIYEKYKS